MNDPNQPAGGVQIPPPESIPTAVGRSPLLQRLSHEFINAQNSVERTVHEMRGKIRLAHERLGKALKSLETEGPGAQLDSLVGLHEEGAAIERLARLLEDQRELLESSVDSCRAVSRRRLQ